VESTWKGAIDRTESSNHQKPSNPEPKSNPKQALNPNRLPTDLPYYLWQKTTTKSRNFNQNKSRNLKISSKNKKVIAPKTAKTNQKPNRQHPTFS
jgi:hypothetical protein